MQVLQDECRLVPLQRFVHYLCSCSFTSASCGGDAYFQSVTLKDLGLRIQLGHKVGDSSIHPVAIDFCGCDKAQSHVQQLLHVRWFPATTSDPRTVATFRVLRQFHILSFESKVSAYEFYHSLVCLTDNTGLLKRNDHYEAFMRMVHEFQHLKMLKRAARGHDPSGIAATQQGDCSVLCPASRRWLYTSFFTIDANFRLKRWIVSKDTVDPSLSNGWSYFVDETAYRSYLNDHGMETQEKSSCASHNAVNMAESKSSKGLAATGLGTIDCARHNMKLPNCHRSVEVLNISYDIACQWHKHLWSRMATLPEDYHLDHTSKDIRFFVPKFHLPMHIAKCQTSFSFNWSHWVGRTDGKAPERGWSNINPVASSTKEMGPGSRRDTLDNHFGDWNWKKVVNLGASLLHKMKEAMREKAGFQVAFEELNTAITEQHRTTWEAKVEQWEANPTNTSIPNPFEVKSVAITQAGAHLRLAELEGRELESGADVSLHPEVSAAVLIGLGLDLEEDQRRVARFAKGLSNHVTDTQRGKLQCQRNVLHRKIESWRTAQALYMPIVQSILSTSTSTSSTSVIECAEDSKLWLPLAIKNRPCPTHLRLYEWELHLAQAHNALQELRQCLRICSSLLTYKKVWVCGQGANTRAQNALERVGWQGGLRSLHPDDIRPLIDPDIMPGQGRRKLTWIWTMTGVDSNGDGTDDEGVRVEWCKARARMMRWAEEFFEWQANWWVEQGHWHTEMDVECLEGVRAYATKQASIRWILWSPFLSSDRALSNIDSDDDADLLDLSAPPLPEM
ncbi:uncharacterized protein EDB91DRAFT_1235984 [Suillus paluster]|uniref:uncharacterized protein n=1 Tax=Suillus paluster TaxID=48578 RepID=UPI001B863CF9|nr:uncharacterized protein EDB91DRAFT_1235984 [Suillus paluster]KAG1747266.1 hypothetical protein EDB91DRAFT_1235984 [Suillus paluster]